MREKRGCRTYVYIDHFFTEKARSLNCNRHLVVIKVEGVPPENIPNNYWLDFASKLEEKPQKKTVVFLPNQGYGNSDEIKIKLNLGWRPFNGIFTSPTNSFNNSFRLASEYEKINSKVLSDGQRQIHILVLITEDKYSTRSLRKFVDGQQLGIVILEIFDFNFERSKIILPNNSTLERFLNKNIPKYVEAVL